MFTTNVRNNELLERLDAESFDPIRHGLEKIVRDSGISLSTLGAIVDPAASITYGIVQPGAFVSAYTGVRMIRCVDIISLSVEARGVLWVSNDIARPYRRSSVMPRDVLIGIAGTLGNVGLAPHDIEPANLNQSVARIRVADQSGRDAEWLTAFLASRFGQAILLRRSVGSVQQHLNLADLPSVPVVMPHLRVRKYVGDKLRQAELLRCRHTRIQEKLSSLTLIPELATLLGVNDGITNRVKFKTIDSNRFDPKYYSQKSLAIVESISQSGGAKISDICESITNGFESRDFQLKGTPYLTVSEISSGRVDITSAPRISPTIEVPLKAKATRNCVLAVRGGSVGIAAKVFEWDESAAISSDLIRLEFGSEDVAAAVAAFLGSECGACLMKRASYGAVMPKLGQDELASIRIPNSILRQGSALNELMTQAEQSTRLSGSLIHAATQLVEALIECSVLEDELIEAQTRLEQGDDSADRAILSRLFEGGWDATETRQLFPDLDAYYETLRMIEREQTEVASK